MLIGPVIQIIDNLRMTEGGLADEIGYDLTEQDLATFFSDMSEDDFLLDNLTRDENDSLRGDDDGDHDAADCTGGDDDDAGSHSKDTCSSEEKDDYDEKKRTVDSSTDVKLASVVSRFAAPVTDREVLEKVKGHVPLSTKLVTQWAVKIWNEWKYSRQCATSTEIPPSLEQINNNELNHWLSKFIMEVRKQDGSCYNSGTLYSICSSIQRYIRENRLLSRNNETLDIYKDQKFALFRCTFDSVLKDQHSKGVGAVKKQAEVITFDLEEELWSHGVLGDSDPRKLLDTLVFLLGLNFALRSGKEHRSLRPDMIELIEKEDEPSYLQYIESGSKNNPGGLNERKLRNKSVKAFQNLENPSRCIVKLYKKYMELRPPSAPNDVFYLQPLQKPTSSCWYQTRPLGHNTLSKTVQKLTEKVGVEGHYTNHSLRRTCVTRLFHEGVEEDKIMSITGHRSAGGVRAYKELSHSQQLDLSNKIQKRPDRDDCQSQQLQLSRKRPAVSDEAKLKKVKIGSEHNFSNCVVNINYN